MYGKSIVGGRLKNASEQPSPVCRIVVKNVGDVRVSWG